MFNRIETKVFVLFVVNVIVWVSLLGLFFYYVAARSLEKQLDSNLKTTASVLASQWDGSLLLLLRPGMEDAPLYQSFSHRLKKLKEKTQLEAIHIVTLQRQNILSTIEKSRIGQSFSRLDLLQPELQQAASGSVAVSSLVTAGQKQYKSALAPIYAGDKVVAVLAIDMSPSYLVYLTSFRTSLIAFTLVALFCCALSARIFSQTITQPISRIAQRVEEIGKAEYEKPLEVQGPEEVARLAASIESMRQNILHRDSQMKMMLSGIAHEIRNPLGGMELFAGILQKENLSPDQREYVRRIQEEIANLKRLLNEFLDFARPRELQFQEIPMHEFINEVALLIGQELKDKNAKWEVDIQSDVQKIHADRAKLKQALLNLYRNAFQAVPDSGTVSSKIYKNGNGIIMEISNTLKNRLSPEIEDKMFEPFFTTKEKGIGLGLPLAKRIIEAHGGEIGLKKNEDTRITFAIHLPIYADSTGGA